MLSRDPQGPGRIGGPPSWSLMPPQEDEPLAEAGRSASLSAIAILPTPSDDPEPFGSSALSAQTRMPRPRIAQLPPPPAAPPAPESATAHTRRPAADPAQLSDSESDAFSVLGGAEFRDGEMNARFGRAVRSVRPRLSFAAQLDLLSMTTRRLVLRIAIDHTGKVTAVDILRSSGSHQVDQPVKVAMYEWWFEPAKGPDGRPIEDRFVFPISWH